MVLGQIVQWDWTSLSYKFKLMNISFKNESCDSNVKLLSAAFI